MQDLIALAGLPHIHRYEERPNLVWNSKIALESKVVEPGSHENFAHEL